MLFSTASATIIHVPADSITIQSALNACNTGDTVLVASDIYYENIIWPNVNSIKLISENGAENTIIDGDTLNSVIIIATDTSMTIIDTTTHIEGFTIQNGSAAYGGGIYLSFASPIITNNIIDNNQAHCMSGGIHSSNGSPIISNNIISNNSASGPITTYAGGIYCSAGLPIISNNIIKNNSASYSGGGIFCICCAIITNNIITKNSNGIGCEFYSSPIIENNIITDNGTGIHCEYYTSPTIRNNIITTNNYDGILCWYYSSPTIYNNTIINNTKGIHIFDSFCNPILSGHPDSTNNLYHNECNYYNYDTIVEARYNYWGNFTSNEIYQTFEGTGIDSIIYLPIASEPLEIKQYIPSYYDTLYFAELEIILNSITGADTIRVNTYIDTLPSETTGMDTNFVNKFWRINLDEGITELDGELRFYYNDSEMIYNIEELLNGLAC